METGSVVKASFLPSSSVSDNPGFKAKEYDLFSSERRLFLLEYLKFWERILILYSVISLYRSILLK